MLCHLMAYDRTKLSVSQTLRPSTRTPCVLCRKPSLYKELRRLGTSSFHEHHRGISMIPLAHADREAHHRRRHSPAASVGLRPARCRSRVLCVYTCICTHTNMTLLMLIMLLYTMLQILLMLLMLRYSDFQMLLMPMMLLIHVQARPTDADNVCHPCSAKPADANNAF